MEEWGVEREGRENGEKGSGDRKGRGVETTMGIVGPQPAYRPFKAGE